MSKGLGEARVDSEKARVELSDWKEHLEKKKNRTPKDDAVTRKFFGVLRLLCAFSDLCHARS